MSEKLPSETCSLIGILGPATYTTSGFSTGSDLGRIDVSGFQSVMATFAIGAWTTAGTIDAKLMECATSNGTYTSISGKAITQMTEAATSANHQAIINLDLAEMTAGYKWLGVHAPIVAGVCGVVMVHGFEPRYKDAVITTAYNDLSTVDEIIT